MEWQPIETAPKDGTEILAYTCVENQKMLCKDEQIRICWYHDSGWPKDAVRDSKSGWFTCDMAGTYKLSGRGIPLLWMPLPDLPKLPTKQE